MRAIPVYRNSVRGLKKTIDMTIEALENNESVLIFPDVDYTSESGQVGELYSGFVCIDKHYYAKTSRHVNFVPISADMKKRRIVFGSPSKVEDGEKYTHARKRIVAELRYGLNYQ
jgi:hypothetical protein